MAADYDEYLLRAIAVLKTGLPKKRPTDLQRASMKLSKLVGLEVDSLAWEKDCSVSLKMRAPERQNKVAVITMDPTYSAKTKQVSGYSLSSLNFTTTGSLKKKGRAREDVSVEALKTGLGIDELIVAEAAEKNKTISLAEVKDELDREFVKQIEAARKLAKQRGEKL